MSDTQDTRTSREQIREVMAEAMAKKCVRPNGRPAVGEPCATHRHYAEADAVLDAIKEAGGKVIVPTNPATQRFGSRVYVGAYRRADGLDSMLLVDREEDALTRFYVNVLEEQQCPA